MCFTIRFNSLTLFDSPTLPSLYLKTFSLLPHALSVFVTLQIVYAPFYAQFQCLSILESETFRKKQNWCSFLFDLEIMAECCCNNIRYAPINYVGALEIEN